MATLRRSSDGENITIEKATKAEHTFGAAGLISIGILTSGDGYLSAGTKRYRIEHGDIIISGGAEMTVTGDEGEISISAIRFRPHIITENLKAGIMAEAPILRVGSFYVRLVETLDEIFLELSPKDSYSHEMVYSLLGKLAVGIARAENEYADHTELCPMIAKAVDYIEKHSGERLSLSDMAELLDVSTAYLSRKFKSELGVGYSDYISSCRLERAGRMLREQPEMSITEIAFSCGFNDSNYFSDKFKKHFGIPPLKYRKK